MRSIFLAILCLSMIVFVIGNDIIAGERKEGDYLVASRRLIRPAVPGKPMRAQTGFNTNGEITSVTAINAPGSDANVLIAKGGPGKQNVVVVATSAPGMGLDVQVDIYATKISDSTTEESASV